MLVRSLTIGVKQKASKIGDDNREQDVMMCKNWVLQLCGSHGSGNFPFCVHFHPKIELTVKCLP